ncbi:uncharacterized protein LOC134283467 isoform X2 [Saccostrea cucullata]|uniref:uncharacterized protein LOC134283467 isoform X2 n=1 Tax=Saccostrea cuccullata TaxID=36930 RepID=UPI002ED5623C
MATKYLACFLLLFERSVCYENLCRKPGIIATQSSDREGLPATKAIDGIDWRPYRFRQFYLDVSNTSAAVSTTSTPQRVRCYKDNTTYPATPPAVFDIPCKQTARYVIIETTYNAPENGAETGPMLEICEMEIYGCRSECFGDTCYSNGECDTCGGGHWGYTCQSHCSSNCYVGSCDKYSGSCNRGCQNGFWGNDCNTKCSAHCLNDICDFEDGTCVRGCKSNFIGAKCQKCSKNHYGPRCDLHCSPSCLNGSCFTSNGTCKYGVNSTFNDGKNSSANDQASKRSKNINSILYGVVTILFISIFLNIFFVVRNLRQTFKKDKTQQGSKEDTNQPKYEEEDDNTGYQELKYLG